MKIGDKVNKWTIIKGSFKINGKNKFTCECECGKNYDYNEGYIKRSNFSKSCRSCSGKERWKEIKKYIIGYTIKNLTIIENKGQQNGNTLYKVKCVCGHSYNTGHTTIIRKHKDTALPYCKSCFLPEYKKPKKNNMLSKHISISHYHKLMRGAKIKGIDFDLTVEYLEKLYLQQNEKCFYTDLKIEMSNNFHKKSDRDNHTISLDRINSKVGYIKGNVQWVHKDINFMKNNFTNEQFLKYCNLINIKHGNPEQSSTYK